MKPIDFIARLEASGYTVMKFIDDCPPKGDWRIFHPDNTTESWVVARHHFRACPHTLA